SGSLADLPDVNGLNDLLARNQRRPEREDLPRRGRVQLASRANRTGAHQHYAFASDLAGFAAVGALGGDTDANLVDILVGLGRGRPVAGIHADHVEAHLPRLYAH